MKYLVLRIKDGAEDTAKNYAEFVLETADNDEMFSGSPTPFNDEYFIGTLDELNETKVAG